ncbi:hypothetical protein [Paenibacillus hamazuiensis]|uniref:hypothetical protein n=1 Tax=Paenibacillus hamazuiensis TaxID=2936508 RepID=UPI00200BE3CF|nr:hypothetical protein [Paenibacillus hamazuiensis]
MTNVWLILLVTIIFIFAFMIVSIWIMNKFMRMYIGTKHRQLEEIVTTKKVPESWLRSFEGWNGSIGSGRPAERGIGDKELRTCLKKLDRLTRYVKKTSLVQDEDTRRMLLADLEQIRGEMGGNG